MPVPKETFKNSNIPKPMRKGKGKIVKIDYKEHEQEVKRIWEGRPSASLVQKWKEKGLRGNQERYYNGGTKLARINKIKILVGHSSNLVGHCCECGNLNTHLVKYETQGITIVERYCSEHVPTP
jgi:hypothetical protein